MGDASIRALKRAGWRDGSRNERSLLDAFQPAPVLVLGKVNVSYPLRAEIIIVENLIVRDLAVAAGLDQLGRRHSDEVFRLLRQIR